MKIENKTFSSFKEALLHGFNLPVLNNISFIKKETPIEIKKTLEFINNKPRKKITINDLQQLGTNLETMNEWMQNNHSMTFQEYLSYSYTNSIVKTSNFDSSLTVNDKEVIVINRIENLLGVWLIATTSKGICMVETAEKKNIEKQLQRIEKYHKKKLKYGVHPYLIQLNKELNEYLEGKRKNFDVPIDNKGTVFQEKVWEILCTIPYGETISYQKQSELFGDIKAIRAIANANGANPIGILVPCHRVIGKDGSLVGFGGKLWRKQHLIDLEKGKLNR